MPKFSRIIFVTGGFAVIVLVSSLFSDWAPVNRLTLLTLAMLPSAVWTVVSAGDKLDK